MNLKTNLTFFFLLVSFSSFAEEATNPNASDYLKIEDALAITRQYLATHSDGFDRDILGIHIVDSHGAGTSNFWLVDLQPYPSGQASPAKTVMSLLIDMKGNIKERGARRLVDPEETKQIEEKARLYSKNKDFGDIQDSEN